MIVTMMGTIAAVLTTSAMFPQAIRIIKTRDVHSISLLMYLANTFGIVFWLIYGVLLQELPIIVANSIAIIPASVILILKIVLGRNVKK
ncbi:SemiSWEET transporter [Carboxylicivirga linearis]|uniref:SemiSWEET transporter n=1 Tax=Carboxylicivirga linearis TaxID=1628157 RepID=A0ABS5JWJ4_9BACT|nr:SemiSWEET transporter [Carboxylicivirga linearis]MBS2099243.1 SemiSWEET transporter [Carboxylicivirga linearis]